MTWNRSKQSAVWQLQIGTKKRIMHSPQYLILHIENFPNLTETQMNSPMDRL